MQQKTEQPVLQGIKSASGIPYCLCFVFFALFYFALFCFVLCVRKLWHFVIREIKNYRKKINFIFVIDFTVAAFHHIVTDKYIRWQQRKKIVKMVYIYCDQKLVFIPSIWKILVNISKSNFTVTDSEAFSWSLHFNLIEINWFGFRFWVLNLMKKSLRLMTKKKCKICFSNECVCVIMPFS